MAIRQDWLARMDAAVERLSDDLMAVDVRASSSLLQKFIDTLEAPPDALHGAVLSTVLMEIGGRVVHALHEQNPIVTCRCEASLWAHVGRFANWRDSDPRLAFRDWLDTFFAGAAREHPPDSAVRAAQIIQREPARSWTVLALANAVDARPTVLRRDFQQRFGMRLSSYVHLTRVMRAVPLLRTSAKVEAVAWEVGYRSKKDLYAALSRWAGSTPTDLRALSDEECAWLERELKICGLRGVVAPTPSFSSATRRLPRDDGRGGSGMRGSRR
jgi:AraC-like DNA-binding protein